MWAVRAWAGLLIAALVASTLPASAATVTVIIDKLAFQPAEVTVAAGDTVEWVNKDAFAHTATVQGNWEVSIAPHASARHLMQELGEANYFCRYHPNMKGRIIVKAR
jgi:plastocyanin